MINCRLYGNMVSVYADWIVYMAYTTNHNIMIND